MAIIVKECEWNYYSSKKQKVTIKVVIPQTDADEAVQMVYWLVNDTQLTLLADWDTGEGSVILGVFLYGGHKHTTGGYLVEFISNLHASYHTVMDDLQKYCDGETKETQHTFQLMALTFGEVKNLLSNRTSKGQTLADVINEQGIEALEDGQHAEN